MSRAKRVDANQADIVKNFRKFDITLSHTHEIGKGFPDVCVGVQGLSIIGDTTEALKILKGLKDVKILNGVNLLIEIKDSSQPASKRKLTEPEEKWHLNWKGQVSIVENEDDIKELLKPLTIEEN